jgi:hypothetical protein
MTGVLVIALASVAPVPLFAVGWVAAGYLGRWLIRRAVRKQLGVL